MLDIDILNFVHEEIDRVVAIEGISSSVSNVNEDVIRIEVVNNMKGRYYCLSFHLPLTKVRLMNYPEEYITHLFDELVYGVKEVKL